MKKDKRIEAIYARIKKAPKAERWDVLNSRSPKKGRSKRNKDTQTREGQAVVSHKSEKKRLKEEIARGSEFFLGTGELSQMLGVSPTTLNDQMRKGKVKGAFRIGDRWRLSIYDALQNWPQLGQIGGPLCEYAKRVAMESIAGVDL